MEENTEWASYSLKEAPYWRKGMTVEEYEVEREYYYKHIEDVKEGKYKPLWKQKELLS